MSSWRFGRDRCAIRPADGKTTRTFGPCSASCRRTHSLRRIFRLVLTRCRASDEVYAFAFDDAGVASGVRIDGPDIFADQPKDKELDPGKHQERQYDRGDPRLCRTLAGDQILGEDDESVKAA